MAAKNQAEVDAQREAEFDRAFALLKGLVDWPEADRRFPVGQQAVYTTSVVLWMLIYQRMNPDASLEAAVKLLVHSRPWLLPDNKRVRQGTLSSNTGGYSRARTRLPREPAEWLCDEVSRSLIDSSAPSWNGRRVFLIDGTTMTLSPTRPLRKAFPPALNQHGSGVWPVALLVMAHDLDSGTALKPAVGAMYGPQAVSETALIEGCLAQMPAESIALADSGYGIFVVAFAAREAQHPFLLRMTQQRFAAVRRQAKLAAKGPNWTTYQHVWRPSARERQSHPQLPSDAALLVSLHEIRIHEELTLYLVSDLPESAWELAELYRRRNDIEIDIRNFKIVLDAENIRARSVEMFYKELLTSLVAYNLVTQFRRQAAELIQEPPRRLSFKRNWTTFRQFLLQHMYQEPAQWREQFRVALKYATQDKLPNRPGRSYPREAYPRRPKSTHFQKRKPNIPPDD
jgi:hypothetical protein